MAIPERVFLFWSDIRFRASYKEFKMMYSFVLFVPEVLLLSGESKFDLLTLKFDPF